MEQKEPKTSDVLAQERTDLAAERTIMAADRTLMAWLRTAIAMIGVEGGYAFYIKNDKLHWVHNYVARDYYHVESVELVPEGHHQLRFEFEVTGQPDIAKGKGTPGRAQLYIDGKLVGNAEVPVTTPLALGLTSGVRCGSAPGAPVTPDYEPPFEFTGKIHSVTVDVSGELIRDDEAEMRAILARQ